MKVISRKQLSSQLPINHFLISLLCNKVFDLNQYFVGAWWFIIFIASLSTVYHWAKDTEVDIEKFLK